MSEQLFYLQDSRDYASKTAVASTMLPCFILMIAAGRFATAIALAVSWTLLWVSREETVKK